MERRVGRCSIAWSRSWLSGFWVFCAFALLPLAANGMARPQTPQTTEGPAEAVPRLGGQLRCGDTEAPDHLNPLDNTTRMASPRLCSMMFSALVTKTWEGEYVPDLAESYWPVGMTNAPTTFEFVLRSGLRWHDGTPLTSEDVAFSWQYMRRSPNVSQETRTYAEEIKNVEIIDPLRLRITLAAPYERPEGYFMFEVIPKHMFTESFESREPKFDFKPIGTGPFALSRWTEDDTIVLKRNADYWRSGPLGNPLPYLDEIKMRKFLDENIMVQVLLTKGIDMTVRTPLSQLPMIQGAGYLTYRHLTLSYDYLAFNNNVPLLADRRIRRAIGMCLNRTAMLGDVYDARGQLINGPAPPGNIIFNPIRKYIDYDPDSAQAVMDSLGFRNTVGNSFRDWQGKEIALTLYAPQLSPTSEMMRVAELIRTDLERVGIHVATKNLDRAAWEDQVLRRRHFDMAIGRMHMTQTAGLDDLFHSNGEKNFSHYSNPQVDACVEAADWGKGTWLVLQSRASRLIAEDSPWIFLWSVESYAAYAPRVRNKYRLEPYYIFSHADHWYLEDAK